MGIWVRRLIKKGAENLRPFDLILSLDDDLIEQRPNRVLPRFEC
jgi:hypothetical protein